MVRFDDDDFEWSGLALRRPHTMAQGARICAGTGCFLLQRHRNRRRVSLFSFQTRLLEPHIPQELSHVEKLAEE